MADPTDIQLHASAAETASGSGSAIDIGTRRSCVKLTLTVSALSGAGASLQAIVETAVSATGPWLSVGSFPALTVARTSGCVFADCRRWVRIRWVMAGASPSIQFECSGAAHVIYSSLGDITAHGLPKEATSSVPAEERAKHALAATGEAEGYLAGGYTMPLVAWDDELRRQVAQIAVYAIMCRRGFQPQGIDELIVKNRDDAISWLKMVAKGIIKQPGIVDSTPTVSGSQARVTSRCSSRGW
jgi:phage gp36-like protein